MPLSTFSSQHRPLSRIFSTAVTAIVSSGLICHLKTAPSSGSTWTDDVGNSNASLNNSPKKSPFCLERAFFWTIKRLKPLRALCRISTCINISK